MRHFFWARYANAFASKLTVVLVGTAVVTGIGVPHRSVAQEVDLPARIDSLARAGEIESVLANWTDPESPGCAVAMTSAGRLVFSQGYGLANLENRVPITPQTVFNIASTSKQFTAMSIALLAERGRADLDQSVRHYIPELPAFADHVTLRHLLHHVGGLRDHFDLWPLLGRDIDGYMEPDEVLALLARAERPNDPPGTRYVYNNGGYFLLAEVVERITGRSLAEFAQTEIFGPLGMDQSRFREDRASVIPNLAESYFRRGEGFGREIYGHQLVGYSDLYTTVEDLAAWDRNFVSNRLGRGEQALIDSLLTRGRLEDGSELRYAMGLQLNDYRGLETVAHGGTMAGYRSYFLRFPEQSLSVIALCNLRQISPFQITRRIADLALAGHFPEPPPDPASEAIGGRGATAPPPQRAVPAERLDDYLGAYLSRELEVVHTVLDVGGAPHVSIRGGSPIQLEYVEGDRFSVGAIDWTFTRDPSGAVDGYVIDYDQAREVRFAKLAAETLGDGRAPSDGGLPASAPRPTSAAPDSVRLRYLHHSGWLIETPGQRLLFDYIGGDPRAEADPGRGWLDPAELADRPLTIFISHLHADHFAPELVRRLAEARNATLVLGWEPADSLTIDPDATIGPHEHRRIGDLDVRTVASTDLGVGFVVRVGDLTVFHAGDHALWSASSENAFKAEINRVADDLSGVDVALMPVATGAACEPRPILREGVRWAAERLRATLVIPMHVQCPDRLEHYAAFAEWFNSRSAATRALFPERHGQWLELDRSDEPGSEGMAAEAPDAENAEDAQDAFDRGLYLLHSFDYERARAAFRDARTRRPRDLMPVWGEAMTYTDPIGLGDTDLESGRRVLRELGHTTSRRMARASNPHERHYLIAAETLFFGPERDLPRRYADFAAAMEAARDRWPRDPELVAFAAMGHLGSASDTRNHRAQMRAAAAAEALFRVDPRHPGAAHYMIHAYDDPVHAPLGERAARIYAEVAPDVPHALHMPSHVFVALGDWDGVVDSNRRAWEASLELAASEGEERLDFHALFWLGYGLLQRGNDARSLAVLRELESLAQRTDSSAAWFRLARMRAAWLAETGRADIAANVVVDTTRLLGTGRAIDAWTRGILQAMARDTVGLGRSVAALQRQIETAASGGRRGFLLVLSHQLEARRHQLAGDTIAAISTLEEAAVVERGMPIPFGPPTTPRLASEALAALLIRSGRGEAAAVWLDEAERRAPGRRFVRSLRTALTGMRI